LAPKSGLKNKNKNQERNINYSILDIFLGNREKYIAVHDLLLRDLKLTSILETETTKILKKILRIIKAFILGVFHVDYQIEKDDC